MKILELYKIIDPTLIWENAINNQATIDSWYLYEFHRYHGNDWGANLWIFNRLEEFATFIPALLFCNILYPHDNFSKKELEEIDVAKQYAEYLKAKEGVWDEKRCFDFVANFKNSTLELKEFDKISKFFTITEEQFIVHKNESWVDAESHDGLTSSMVSVLREYSKKSDKCPALSSEAFLNFVSGEINECLW